MEKWREGWFRLEIHSRVAYLDLLVNVDSTQLCYIPGSSTSEEYFHTPSTTPNVKGTHKTLEYAGFLTMWVVQSAAGTLGSLLFIIKCPPKVLPDNKVRVGCIPSLSPEVGHFARPAYVVFVNKETPEHNWVVNGIKLEIILDHVHRFRNFKQHKPANSLLPKLFATINGRASDTTGWSIDVLSEETKVDIESDEKKEAAKKKKKKVQRFPLLPFPPVEVPPSLKYRAVVWADSEHTFLDYLLVKKQQERCSELVVDLVKSNPGATAVEQPADQDGFRDVKRLLLSNLSSTTPDTELSEDFHKMMKDLKIKITPKRLQQLCCFFTALQKILPTVYHPSRVQNQFIKVFGPDPLKPSRDQILGKALGWNRLTADMQKVYVDKIPSIVSKFTTQGFVTDHDWEGCPWDKEFDEHRDHLTLSKQTCLHMNHEGSKKKREEEEKLKEAKDKADEEKKTKKATKKREPEKEKELPEKTRKERAHVKEEAKARKEEALATKKLGRPPAAKRTKR